MIGWPIGFIKGRDFKKMKKKTFYQTNVLWQLFCFMILAVFITCLILGVQLLARIINNGLGVDIAEKIISIFLLILYFTATLLILRLFIRFEHNNIYLTNEKIYMNDDWNNKKNKIQYYSEVKFIDIESIDIIWTKENSNGKIIRSRLFYASIEKPYLSIKCKDEKVVNFFIMYISKKDVIKIISEISCRMKSVGNNSDTIKDDEAYSKINRKAI